MADIENQQDSSFPVKRKSDVFYQDQDNVLNKAQKLNPLSNSTDPESKDGEINGSGLENLNSSTEAKIGAESSVENGVIGDHGAEEDHKVGEEGDEEEDDGVDRNGKRISREDKGKGKLIEMDESEDEEEEEVNRNGLGFSREDKGKGKLIEVDESDEEDDSDDEDDDCFGEDDESDFSDDPLAEVDLDNILPSRTRRRSSQPGVYISNEVCNDEDDDSSEDSDA